MSVQFRSEACMMVARELYARGVWNKTLVLTDSSDHVLQGNSITISIEKALKATIIGFDG